MQVLFAQHMSHLQCKYALGTTEEATENVAHNFVGPERSFDQDEALLVSVGYELGAITL